MKIAGSSLFTGGAGLIVDIDIQFRVAGLWAGYPAFSEGCKLFYQVRASWKAARHAGRFTSVEINLVAGNKDVPFPRFQSAIKVMVPLCYSPFTLPFLALQKTVKISWKQVAGLALERSEIGNSSCSFNLVRVEKPKLLLCKSWKSHPLD